MTHHALRTIGPVDSIDGSSTVRLSPPSLECDASLAESPSQQLPADKEAVSETVEIRGASVCPSQPFTWNQQRTGEPVGLCLLVPLERTQEEMSLL